MRYVGTGPYQHGHQKTVLIWATSLPESVTAKHKLLILSANLRGFRTNVSELTHSFILGENLDVAATVRDLSRYC